MQKNKLILRFISKNLSWGIFRQAITNNMQDDEGEILAYFSNILLDHPTIKLRAPETMLFLIIELQVLLHTARFWTTIRCRLKN